MDTCSVKKHSRRHTNRGDFAIRCNFDTSMSRLSRAFPVTRLQSTKTATRLQSTKTTISDLVPSLQRLKLAEAKYTVPASMPISGAAQHLVNERLTYALVLDDLEQSDSQKHHKAFQVTTNNVVGMLTERNVLQYAIDAGSFAFFSGRESEPPTSRWMTPRAKMLSVRLDDSLEDAVSKMRSGIWRHLPVLDYYNKFHSILDLRDVLLERVGPDERDAVWKGCSALDILGAKRKSKIAASDLAPAASDWRDALSEYLLAHAQRHTISSSATVERAARQMDREQVCALPRPLRPCTSLTSSDVRWTVNSSPSSWCATRRSAARGMSLALSTSAPSSHSARGHTRTARRRR